MENLRNKGGETTSDEKRETTEILRLGKSQEQVHKLIAGAK